MEESRHLEPLPHISFRREPEHVPIRTRKVNIPGVVPRSNRSRHAKKIREETVASIAKVGQIREELGVIASRLLVLRLEVLDVNQRETLELLGISVVEELEEKQGNRKIYKLVVQFPDEQSLTSFSSEYDSYSKDIEARTALPPGKRRNLFDALESVSPVTEIERQGRRLRREGKPKEDSFYLDVDLWNPGSPTGSRELFRTFREFVESCGGCIVNEPLTIPSMILVKVRGNRRLLDDLLKFDLVSLVDLPPLPLPEDSFDLLKQIQLPDRLPSLSTDGPQACVVDSGVLAGHPLLRGVVVAEEDFDSGENTPVDMNGHGTQVSGLVVYGNIAQRIDDNEWIPQVQLYSAKILQHDPVFGNAIVPDVQRVEDQLKRAIEYFHSEYGCRVFNVSIGHPDRLYEGGRQFACAELLDDLARTLDIVIVVSAGNVDPSIPVATNSEQFKRKVAHNLNTPAHRLIDPSTAALCLSVGAIARRDDPGKSILGNQLAVASAQGCPSVFTRCGPGVAGAVKPELVAPGGNYVADVIAGKPTWSDRNPNLGEPTLNHDFTSGRQLSAVCGTSVAAAHVTHVAARMETALQNQFGERPSQNLIRALIVNSARVDDNVEDFFPNQAEVLNTVGYGQPDDDFCWSLGNRVTLVSEDTLEYRKFHVYSLIVPSEFITERGNRSISVSLAYDPPTRSSRKDYIATAMWLELFGGLTTQQVIEYRSKYEGGGKPPKVPDKNVLDFLPRRRTVMMSTVQKRCWHSNRGTLFLNRSDPNGDASLHIFVGCRPRFPNPLQENTQRYALVVTLEHTSQHVDIYQEIRSRVRTRPRVRVTS